MIGNQPNNYIKESILRILHVFRTYFPEPPGGVQEVIRQICLSTSVSGLISNTVYTLSPKPNPRIIQRPEGVVIRERSWMSPASCDIGGIASIASFAEQVRHADIIHYHFPWPFGDVLHSLVRPKIPSIVTYHSDIVRQRWLGLIYSPLMWHTLKSMDVIVATSPNYARTSTILNQPSVKDKVKVIPLGIDEHSYATEHNKEILEKLNLNNQPFFLFLGVPRYYKGVHTLIKAAKLVNAKIVIAGTGGELEQLKQMVGEFYLKNVIFAGFVSDSEKITLIKACRALVLPSHLRSEAFGMVLIEAAMFSKPMISCDIGTGTSYVNVNEETGFVVEPEQAESLGRAMNTLLNEESLANQMGFAARLRYERLFSGPALGQAYTSLYNELL